MELAFWYSDSLNHSGTEKINTAAFSPDGKLVLTATDSEITVWTKDGKAIKSLAIPNAENLVFHPDPEAGTNCYWFAINDVAQNQIVLYELCLRISGLQHRRLGNSPEQSRGLTGLDISSSNLVVVLCEGDFVQLWQINPTEDKYVEFSNVGDIKGHIGLINQAIFDPSGENLFTISDDQTIKKWGLSGSARPYDQMATSKNYSSIETISFCGHPDLFLSNVSPQTEHYLMLVAPGSAPRNILEIDGGSPIVEVSADRSYILTATKDPEEKKQEIKVWSFDGKEISTGVFSSDNIVNLNFLENSNHFLVANKEGEVQIRDLQNKIVDTLTFNFAVTTVQPSPVDSNLLLVYPDNVEGHNQIRLYDISGDLLQTFYSNSELDEGGIARFSPSGSFILTVDYDKIEVWTTDGTPFESLPSFDQSFQKAAFSPDEQYLAVIDDNTCIIYDLWDQENVLLIVVECSCCVCVP